MSAHYSFIENLDHQGLKKFLAYINDCLYRVRKFNYLPGMRETWQAGKEKAEARLKQLERKKTLNT